MTNHLIAILLLSMLVVRAPSQAASAAVEGVVFNSHSGEVVDPASGPLSAGMTSGDFKFSVKLVGEGVDRAVVGLVWAFVQDGVPVTHRDGSQFFEVPQKAGAVFSEGVADVALSVPYAYRDSARRYPEAPLGESVLRAYIGGSGMQSGGPNAPPAGFWCVVDTPVKVVHENPAGYGFLVEDHRRLKLASQVSVCVVRPLAVGNEVMELHVKQGSALLGSSLAFFPDGSDVTTVNICPVGVGAVVLMGRTATGDTVLSMPFWCGGGDEFPAPLPPNSGNANACDFVGGPESGLNPKIICSDCYWFGSPVAPPECAAAPAQQFVQNGRCSPSGWLGQICCKWTRVNVPAAKAYTLTAAPALQNCGLAITLTIPRTRGAGSVTWQPQMLCCVWTVDPTVAPAPTAYNKCTTRPWIPGPNGGCQ